MEQSTVNMLVTASLSSSKLPLSSLHRKVWPLLSRSDILALGIAGTGVEHDASAGLEPLSVVVPAMFS